MPPISSPAGPIHWILDWDGTITKRDTLDALVRIATECKPDRPIFQEWKRVTQAYIDDYGKALESLVPTKELPSTVSGEKSLLAALEEVEQRSIDRVSASGIFADLTSQDLDEGATLAVRSGRVHLRDGFSDFLQQMQSRGALNILSVNWSQRFIMACLRAACEDAHIPPLESILSNELEGIRRGSASSGRIGGEGEARIISSRDKLTMLKTTRKKATATATSLPVIYLGDSWTDFECLLSADLGICIRDDPPTSTQQKLADSLRRLGIHCPRLRDTAQADDHAVVWARDYAEINEWIDAARR